MTTYTVAQALAAAQSGTPLTGAAILDSAADVQANIDALQPLATAGEISTISFTDQGSPKITVTIAQDTNDMTAINMFQGQRTVDVTGATVAQAFAIEHQQHVAIGISDTGTNVESNIDAISNIANEITGITITDGTIPSFSASQMVNDSAVIGGITVAGIDASKAVANANAVQNIHGLEVTDTAANISSNITGLEALAATGKLTSITLTDSGVPVVAVSPAELTADGSAIGTIQGNFILQVDGSNANLTLTGPNGVANELVLTGTPAEYSFTGGNDGKSFTITETGTGRSSTDHLNDFAAVQFNNGGSGTPTTAIIASDTPTTAGAVASAQVASLYAAVLNRTPDVSGLVFYENQANSNPSLGITQIATEFLQSPEYTKNSAHNYAQTTAGETQFITDTYQNLLHRAPEAGAVQWYETNQINPYLANQTPGTASYAAADLAAHALVLASFSQSAEFRADVSVTGQNPASASHWLVLI
jgi:hypothetical protein